MNPGQVEQDVGVFRIALQRQAVLGDGLLVAILAGVERSQVGVRRRGHRVELHGAQQFPLCVHHIAHAGVAGADSRVCSGMIRCALDGLVKLQCCLTAVPGLGQRGAELVAVLDVGRVALYRLVVVHRGCRRIALEHVGVAQAVVRVGERRIQRPASSRYSRARLRVAELDQLGGHIEAQCHAARGVGQGLGQEEQALAHRFQHAEALEGLLGFLHAVQPHQCLAQVLECLIVVRVDLDGLP